MKNYRFGVSDEVMIKMQRVSGADMILVPGPFATASSRIEDEEGFIEACGGFLGKLRRSLPVIAGGKSPAELGRYATTVGSTDFMVIAATAVDEHPSGLEARARAFREAWEEISAKGN